MSHAKVDTIDHHGELSEGPILELLAYLAQNPVEGARSGQSNRREHASLVQPLT